MPSQWDETFHDGKSEYTEVIEIYFEIEIENKCMLLQIEFHPTSLPLIA